MDLIGQFRKNTPKEIVAKHEGDPHIHYNWTGWAFLINFLMSHGVDTSEFGDNSGELIKRDTCAAVARCLKAHLSKLKLGDRLWLLPHIEKWEWAKNYKQY